jgi:tetratricopeptide (TPR) repeat protein/predicted nuclease with TOPRIM domain
MKKHPWLDSLENISLVGLGVGTAVSVISKQVLYTTTPLSLLVVLGLLSRRRLDKETEQNTAQLNDADRRLTQQLNQLDQHVTTLPTPEKIHRLARGLLKKDQEISDKLDQEIAAIRQDMRQWQPALSEEPNEELNLVRRTLSQLNDKYNMLLDGLAQLNADLAQLSDSHKDKELEASVTQFRAELSAVQTTLEGVIYQTKPNLAALQEQVARLDRQFSKLPPPVDASSLRQEIGELVRMIADLVPRRDLAGLVNEIKELHQQQQALKQSITATTAEFIAKQDLAALTDDLKHLHQQQDALKQSVAAIKTQQTHNLDLTALTQDLSHLRQHQSVLEQSIAAIEASAAQFRQTFSDLSAQTDATTELTAEVRADETSHPGTSTASGNLFSDLPGLAANYLTQLRSQFLAIQHVTEQLSEQQTYLQNQINQLPKTLDVTALQHQMRELSEQIPSPEQTANFFRDRFQEVLHQELQYINQQLRTLPTTPNYELIFDLNATQTHLSNEMGVLTGSRAILEEALEQTQNRLILIWPWSNQCHLDASLVQKLETLLSQKRQLDIGWCYLADRHEERLLSKIRRGWMNDPTQQSVLQETLHQFLQLKRTYPENFQFKILGTSENFLVSDRSFAVLGIADALKTTTDFSELQLKLRTKDPDVIQRLIQRFDKPSLASDDLAAYWNRAVTRYDLGDRTGAIADYTHVLSVNSNDATTYNYRGVALYEVGNVDAALADFTQSIQLNSHQSAAYCNRGFILSERGDQWGAINDYSLAVQAQPDAAVAYFYRGLAWQKLDDLREAVTDYSEAVHFAPNSPVARYYRGLAWQKLGNYEGAIADLEAAADLFMARGSQTNAQKAQKSLTKLRQETADYNEFVDMEALSLSAKSAKREETTASNPSTNGVAQNMRYPATPNRQSTETEPTLSEKPLSNHSNSLSDAFHTDSLDKLFQDSLSELEADEPTAASPKQPKVSSAESERDGSEQVAKPGSARRIRPSVSNRTTPSTERPETETLADFHDRF